MSTWKTAVLDDRGERLAVFDDSHSAYEWAVAHGFSEIYAEEILAERVGTRAQNPLGEAGPRQAWASLGNLRVSWSEVERLTLEDAYQRILRLRVPKVVGGRLSAQTEVLWPFTRITAGKLVTVKRWQTPHGMAKHLLADNDKLAKRHPAQPARVAGLSLLPAFEPARKLIGRVPILRESTTFCIGSNPECRASCLVFSGRNEIDPHNTRVKTAKAGSLLADPIAFCRILVESVRVWQGQWPAHARKRLQPFVRLNVFSDLPWELIFPELFVRAPGVMFYDYTKIPFRPEACEEAQRVAGVPVFPFPANYDLTFSASGTNDSDAYAEWSHGRRVAVVFDTDRHVLPQWYEPPFAPVSIPVIDGDQSDVRPLDPSATALEHAREQLGAWTLSMTESQREKRQRAITKLAYKLTFGGRAPLRYTDYPARGPAIVGLSYKAPMMPVRRAEAEAEQEKGRARGKRSETKRAFLVSVIERGKMVIAPGCPKTVTFTSPVIPSSQPGIRDLELDEQRFMLAAKRR